jgi:hypothetical protein
MKPFLLLIAACASAAPLSAQGEGPGNDLIELFEKSQREGTSDEELMRMLEDKALLDLRGPEPGNDDPDAQERRDVLELQFQKDMEKGHFRPLKEITDFAKPSREEDDGTVRRNTRKPASEQAPTPPRWIVGLVVSPLDPALRAHFDLPEGSGVVVESVMRGSPAAEAGIKTKDLLVTADGRKVASLEDLRAAVEKAGSEGKAIKLDVIQRGKRSIVEVKPRGPEAPAAEAERKEPGPAMRPMIEIQRRLDQQQKEIEALKREIRELRAQKE